MPYKTLSTSILLALSHLLFAAAQNQTDPARYGQCFNAELYQHPNASASFPVAAVDAVPDSGVGITLNSSLSASWTVTNVLGQSLDPYGNSSKLALNQALFLDTSSTLENSSSAHDLGLAGCVFIFNLPKDSVGKDDNGDCTSVLSSQCVRDFTKLAAVAAQSVATDGWQAKGQNLTNGDACVSIERAIRSLPGSCSKSKFGGGGWGYSPLTLDPPSPSQNTNCSTAPIPQKLFSSSILMLNATDYTTYDQWARTITPTLLTVFSNATSGVKFSQPFGDAHLVCSTPKNVQAGSRVPAKTGGAVHVYGAVNIRHLVWWALAVNTFLFMML